MKFSIEDFFNKCDQICKKLRVWSHLLEKSLIENFIFLYWKNLDLNQILILDFLKIKHQK